LPGRHKRPAAAESRDSAALFAALGDETRIRLVWRLSTEGPQSIASLTGGTAMTRQAVTKHLRMMETVRLVHCEKLGRESRWRLDHRRLSQARQYLDAISAQWDHALGRLKALVEEGGRIR